ncbi:radical SAM protein [Granulicella arctica]|uniref:radical SAM protein n=1 Tax=Granulicella arctica TaxID=940613 RepID=UPI0021E00CBD|nr:radical SAM protein [Granulicella arctica]
MMRYLTIGLLYTRTCPLACRHCIIESSPKVAEKMEQSVASEYIKVIARYSDQVCFTGGEPLLYYNEIIPLIREARALGLGVSLVTGCGWVSTAKPHIARERIAGLKEAGLNSLTVSWDEYHEEFSPQENALLVVKTAKEIGLPVEVRGVVNTAGPIPRIEQKLITIGVRYEKAQILRLGAAATLPESHFTFGEMPHMRGCRTVLQPVIEPNGQVYGCCGPSRGLKNPDSPLTLGNTNDESLESIFSRSVNDPLLEAISNVGPYALFNLIKDEPSLKDTLPVRSSYTGICEVCLDLSSVPEVITKLRERISEPAVNRLMSAMSIYYKSSPELQAQVECF